MENKYENMTVIEKNKIFYQDPVYVDAKDAKIKINSHLLHWNIAEECEREKKVSYFQMLPLLEENVRLEDADYVLYAHPYARVEDRSKECVDEVKALIDIRKKFNKEEDQEIIIVGKACNVKKDLEGVKNITYYSSHFAEHLGKRFGMDMKEKYFVYNEDRKHLSIWPVDGCLNKCGFCRRSYMEIPFESLPLEYIKEHLDWYKENEPEKMKNIFLRAENLTEYGLDIYGKQELHKVIDLVDSYDEVESINFLIGMNIGEITPEILDSLCRSKKISRIGLNLEAGSDRLLKLIGKKHTTDYARYVYQTLRQAHPDLYITSTIMIGLPTEELDDIYQFASLIQDCMPDDILCNYYGYSEQHPIAKLPQISDSLKRYHQAFLIKCLKEMVRIRDFTFLIERTLIPGKRKDDKEKEQIKRDQEYNIFRILPRGQYNFYRNVPIEDIDKYPVNTGYRRLEKKKVDYGK